MKNNKPHAKWGILLNEIPEQVQMKSTFLINLLYLIFLLARARIVSIFTAFIV